jgi:hypothetical protein
MTFFSYPGVPSSNNSFSQPVGPGLNHAVEYMASGLPFVTSSILTTTVLKIELPYVTSKLNFNAVGGTLRFGFTENGVNNSNYYLVTSGDGNFGSFDIRCKTIYVRADTSAVTMSFCAAMTTIDRDKMPLLTGSLADPITGKCQFLTGSTDYSFGFNGIG